MKIGVSTYAYRWAWGEHEQLKNPLTLFDMIDKTKQFSAEVFQICDYPLIEEMDHQALVELKEYAHSHQIELEVGTQGIEPSHLEKYVNIAKVLESKVIRTMVHDQVNSPSIEQAKQWLNSSVDLLEEAGISIALETYEPVKTKDLIEIVQDVNSEKIGICLDPGNSISELEFPDDVIRNTAPYVTNVHFKDFRFTRRAGSVGFNLLGSPVGEGQLNLEYLLETIEKHGKNVNGVIELWLPFTETIDKTIELQNQWIERSVQNLQNMMAAGQKASV